MAGRWVGAGWLPGHSLEVADLDSLRGSARVPAGCVMPPLGRALVAILQPYDQQAACCATTPCHTLPPAGLSVCPGHDDSSALGLYMKYTPYTQEVQPFMVAEQLQDGCYKLGLLEHSSTTGWNTRTYVRCSMAF